MSYTYPASGPGSVRPHAVTSLSTGWTFQYDANGNVTQRVEGGTTYVQEFDAENRLQRVTVGGQVTEFDYDGDGNRVKKVAGGQTTVYVGNYYEKQGATVTTYYYVNGQRVAMRVDDGSQEVVYYLHADHLGSTSLTTDASGGVVAEQRYYPYGEERWASGTLPPDRRFTGQRWEQGLGLYDYNARWYHPALGRFVSADTVVPEPGNPQGLNRFAYVYNNPLRYTDPTGYYTEEEIQEFLGVGTWEDVLAFFEEGGSLEGRWGWLEILRQGKDGDFVYVSEPSSPFQWFGKFAAFDNGLYIETYSRDGYLAMEEVAGQYDYYRIRRGEWSFATEARERYYHWRIEESKIDWAGFSLDAGGGYS